jgi:hypothetical protein
MNLISVLILTTFICNAAGGGRIGTFLQITDIHFDAFYQEGSAANCFLGSTGLGCCRHSSISKSPHRIASRWGDYNCDSPRLFVEESLKWIAANHATADFVIWNGDSVDHHDITQSLSDNVLEINTTTSLMKQYFKSGTTRIFPINGNHDTYPIDQLGSEFNTTRISKYLNAMWQDMLPDDTARATFARGGYYLAPVIHSPDGTPTLQLMVLNSLLYDSNNLLLLGHHDPSDQNVWIVRAFDTARAANTKIWIAGHIPLGSSETHTNFSNFFYKLCAEYSDVVQYSFWGHTHTDYYYLTFDAAGPVGLSFVAPSMMNDHQLASYREYTYDKDTMKILDYKEYVANLTEIIANDTLEYKLYYSARHDYGVAAVTPSEFYNLYLRMSHDDNLMDDYHKRHNPGNIDVSSKTCDITCKQSYLKEIIDITQSNKEAIL